MVITSTGGRDPALAVPISAVDAYSKVFKDFKNRGIAAATSVAAGFKTTGAISKKSILAISSAAKTMSKVVVVSFAAISAAIIHANNEADQFEEALVAMGRVTDQTQKSISASLSKIPPILGNLTELTRGYYQVISAGVTRPAQAIQVLTESSRIARVTHLEQGEVVKGLTKIMAGYGGQIRSVSQAADILYTIEKLGQTTVGELIPVIGGLAKQSADLKINTDELGASLAQITQFAGDTDEAATQYRATLTQLLSPSVELAAAFKDMGYESAVASIESKGFVRTLQDLYTYAGGTDEKFRGLFTNVRAASGAAALASNNFSGLIERVKGMTEGVGASAKAWDDWSNTGSAATSRLRANITNFFIQLGQATRLTELKNNISAFIETNGARLVTFFTRLPTVASAAFKLMGDAYTRLIDEGFFGGALTTRANANFQTIQKNFSLFISNLSSVLTATSMVLWAPLRIAFINTIEGIKIIFSRALNKMRMDQVEWQLKLANTFDFIPGIKNIRVNLENELDAVINEWDVANERLKGFDITAGLGEEFSSKLTALFSALAESTPQFADAVTGGFKGFTGLIGELKDAPEFQDFLAFLDTFNTEVATSEASLTETYEIELDARLNALMKLATEEARIEEKRTAESKKQIAFRIRATQDWASASVNIAQALYTASGEQNKSTFEALKVAKTAEALVNTYAGAAQVVGDASLPYYVKIAGVASILALGFSQVAAISQTSFGSSSSASSNLTSSQVSAGLPTPSQLAPDISAGEGATPQQISIIINSPLVSENWDDITENQIAPALRRAGERDVEFVVTTG